MLVGEHVIAFERGHVPNATLLIEAQRHVQRPVRTPIYVLYDTKDAGLVVKVYRNSKASHSVRSIYGI